MASPSVASLSAEAVASALSLTGLVELVGETDRPLEELCGEGEVACGMLCGAPY